MVFKGAVLLRVQHFQQGRCRVTPEITGHFIDLVHQNQRVAAFGCDHGIDQLAGHRANIGAAVAADLGFIAHAAQAHAHIFAVHALGHRAGDRGFAHARRAHQTNDLSLHIGIELAHRQNFQNAVLHFFQAVMLTVQDLLCLGNVQLILCRLIPRQIKAGIQIGADHTGLGAVALHTGQAVGFFQQLGFHILLQAQRHDLAAVGVGFGMGILALAQLLADDMHLLTQIIVTLVFIHLIVDLVINLALHSQNFAFALQKIQQCIQPGRKRALVQHSLLILIFHQQIGGHVIAQIHGAVTAEDIVDHILRDLRAQR